MAQRLFSFDLGTHSVKVAELEMSFRSASLLRIHSCPVQPGPEPPFERSLRAIDSLAIDRSPTDAVVVGMPGDRVLMRLLAIPFSEPKKIGAVVGHELADDIPWDFEDVIYDYHPLSNPRGKVLAAAAHGAEVRALLEKLAEGGVEPRGIAVAPLAYDALVRQVDPAGTVMVVDIGHRRTNICMVLEGRSLIGRTISRAGHQVTEALRQSFQMEYVAAEELKERSALLAMDAAGLDAGQLRMAEVTAAAMAPLVRDVRLTHGLFTGRLGRCADRVLLCGGTSQISGIDRHLEAELGLPCARFQYAAEEAILPAQLSPEGEAVSALSVSMALGQTSRQMIDLRQGEFAFQTDKSILTEKLVHIAVAVVVVLVFAAVNAYVSLHSLRKEEKTLKAQLRRSTRSLFGKTMSRPKSVSRKIKRGCMAKTQGIPPKTAFDILDLLSREIPGKKDVQIDLRRLEIKPGKTYLKGTANSQSAVGDIVKALKANECFSKIAQGKISEVSEGKKQFSLTITTDCF